MKLLRPSKTRVVPASKLWLYKNKAALASVRKDIAQAAVGRTVKRPSYRAYAQEFRETLEVLNDKKLMLSLRKGLLQAKAGKTIPWKQARRRLAV